MAQPRIYGAETLLHDGRVLAVEGTQTPCQGPIVSEAEIYDPSTKSWSQTGSLLQGRETPAQNLVTLQSGKVLVAGGVNLCSVSTVGDAELFDPNSGTWSSTGSMNTPRAGAQFIMLDDGRILAAGGYLVAGPNLNTVEIYNPSTGTWSYTGSLSSAHGTPQSVKLQDGRVLVAGGSRAGQVLTDTAIYDSATNSWISTASLPQPRVGHSAFLLNDGRVIFSGGNSTQGPISTSVIYNPLSNSYTNGPSLNYPRWNQTQGVKLGDGSVLIEGGITDTSNTGLASAEIYVGNPITLEAVGVSSNPTQINTSITASSSFIDTNNSEAHTSVWNWGDGSTSVGTVTESNGSGTVSDSHTYTTAGVYTVTLTVTNSAGAQASQTYQYEVVYDPSAGWVTGSKEFTSPQGAVIGNTGATGIATFGFQVKYQNGSMVPSGKNISLDFPDGNISFVSTSYQWLVVNNPKAVFMANGTLNSVSGYTILISNIDQSSNHVNGLIRIQIRDANQNVVYDTQPGDSGIADPITEVTKGKISVH